MQSSPNYLPSSPKYLDAALARWSVGPEGRRWVVARLAVLQAERPLIAASLGLRVRGLVRAWAWGWVGNSKRGESMMRARGGHASVRSPKNTLHIGRALLHARIAARRDAKPPDLSG